MKTPYTIHNPPPYGKRITLTYRPHDPDYKWAQRAKGPACEAVVSSFGGLNVAEDYWDRCNWAAKANGYCHIHQYLAEGQIMAGFYMVVTESSQQATCKYASLEEAQAVAERLARKNGEDVFILKPVKKASVHRVDWEEMDEMDETQP